MRLFLSLTVCLLTACSSVDYTEPEPLPLDGTSFSDTSDTSDQPTAEGWWLSFSDPELNQLIDTALKQNYSLKSALARLRQSQARWDVSGADKYPDLTLTAQRARRRTNTDAGVTETTEWGAGLSTSYELDFWGRVSAAAEQGKWQVWEAGAAADVRANTVASQVALNWYGLLKENKNLALLEDQQQRIMDALEITRARYLRGLVSVSDVWQQEQLLESIRTDIITGTAQRDEYRQQLAIWTGVPSVSSETENTDNTHHADLGEPITQVSAETLKSRPDVLQAYYRLRSASAGLAVAVANRYPRFTLTASYNGNAEAFSDVLNNGVSNLVAGLTQPLFNGGALTAEVSRNEAVVEEALSEYQQTLLNAILEVELALIAEKQQADTTESIERRLELARKTEAFQKQRYQRGIGNFLALLNSQQDVLSLERQKLSSGFIQIQNRVQLLKSLSRMN